MDCTYKTNAYQLPLLNIVGMTAENKTFTAATIFICQETFSWYSRAMDVFKEVLETAVRDIRVIVTNRDEALMGTLNIKFPEVKRMLCSWHINKNLVAAGQKGVEEDIWNQFMKDWKRWVVYARNTEEYYEGEARFKRTYKDVKELAKGYSYACGLLTIKQYFVHAYTNGFRHYGQRDSSRVEGEHQVFKRFLSNSKGDLLKVVTQLLAHLNVQFQKVTATMEISFTKALVNLPKALSTTNFIISKFAQQKVWGQYKIGVNLQKSQLRRDDAWEENDEVEQLVDCPEPCTQGFFSTYGIPCHHMVARVVNDDKQVGPEMFAKQWWLVHTQDLGQRAVIPTVIDTSENGDETRDQARTLNLDTIRNPPVVNVRRKTMGTDQYHVIEISSDEDEAGQPESQLPRFTGEAGTLRRLPSQFEHVEGAASGSRSSQQGLRGARARPKCSICRKEGHKRNNCAERPGQRIEIDEVTGIEFIDATLDL